MTSPSPQPVDATSLSSGTQGPAGLPPKLVEDAAKRLSILAVFLVVVVVVVQVVQRFGQPELALIIDDPVNRLATLASVLMAIGLFALQRLRLVTARTAARARHGVRGRRRDRDFDDRNHQTLRPPMCRWSACRRSDRGSRSSAR
jgi:hypothetical protein